MNINRKLQKIQRELAEIANYIADETEGMEFRKYLKDPNNFTNKELKEMHDDAVKYRTKIKNRDIRDEVFLGFTNADDFIWYLENEMYRRKVKFSGFLKDTGRYTTLNTLKKHQRQDTNMFAERKKLIKKGKGMYNRGKFVRVKR